MYSNSQSPGLDIAQGIIGAGASYLSTREQSKTARRNTDKTNQANRALAEYQYSKDLEMWRLQNEYNTPQAQMQRFKDAGLNPHLMYGQGDSGNASQMPKYNAPRMDYGYKPDVNPMQMISEFLNLKQQSAQIDNIQAQTQKTQFDSIASEWMADIKNLERLGMQRRNEKDAIIHGKYMQDGAYENEYQALLSGLEESVKRTAAIELKNRYQAELNRLIKQGLAPGDDYRLRIGMSLLNALGVNTTDLMKQLNQINKK